MSRSSGKMLEEAFQHKCNAGIWLVWMLVKKKIPKNKLSYIIDQLEETLKILRTIRDGAQT